MKRQTRNERRKTHKIEAVTLFTHKSNTNTLFIFFGLYMLGLGRTKTFKPSGAHFLVPHEQGPLMKRPPLYKIAVTSLAKEQEWLT